MFSECGLGIDRCGGNDPAARMPATPPWHVPSRQLHSNSAALIAHIGGVNGALRFGEAVLAGVLPCRGSSTISGSYAGQQLGHFARARNVSERPSGLTRRGPGTGELAKAAEPDPPQPSPAT